MVILESSIYFDNTKLIEKLYPGSKTGELLEKDLRDSLIQAIGLLAHNQFHDEVHGASIGNFQISMISREISFPGNDKVEKPLFMYSVADLDTDMPKLIKAMNDVLDQFVNRFSRNDIYDKKIKKFHKFESRFEKMFDGFIFSLKDRLSQIF